MRVPLEVPGIPWIIILSWFLVLVKTLIENQSNKTFEPLAIAQAMRPSGPDGPAKAPVGRVVIVHALDLVYERSSMLRDLHHVQHGSLVRCGTPSPRVSVHISLSL